MKKIIVSILAIAVSMTAFAKKEKTAVEVFDRGIGISTSTFIPKGTVGFGTSFSYSTYSLGNSADDYGFQMLFGMLNGINANIVTGGVSPNISYFVANNLAIGGRFDYKHTMLGLGSANLSISEDMSFGINDFNYMKDAYYGALFAKYFIPFGTSKRFAMFAELRASGGYAQAQSFNTTELDKNGTFQDIYDFEIGVIPGITAFVTNQFALEVSVGLVGLNYQKVVQRTDNIGVSVAETSGANFKLNLLNISLGIQAYIPTGQKKAKKAMSNAKKN